ncbi:MAG TPA: C10 family peptidase, partial [candidate division Zixibacteria bacterium]|nr:C10 family peptidase [candidate division Zixibacteria bacterium]
MKLSYRAARFSHRLVLLAATSLLATTAPTVRAERASSSEMSRACENWLTQVVFTRGAWAGAAAPTVLGAHELAVGDTLLARYYDISPRGFVLVAALKEMTPVKAYSDRYNLDDSQSGGFLAMITEQLANRTRLYAEMFGSLEAAQPPEGPALFGRGQKAEWTRLTLPAGEFGADLAAQAARATRDGGPLCTTSWDQGYPYNKFCPQGQYGTSVVGCVATAASQVIAYWQWPPSGVGSHTYYWDGDQYCGGNYGGGYLTASYSDSYDWANIVDSCSLGCTPAQEDAVAELCYEVGVAFDMDYSSCGSAAYTGQAVLIYPQYFKFSPDVRRVDRSAYSLHEWFDLVKNEIDSGRVVQYRINLHSIVLDGYREQIPGRYEYHMNYGWADAFNAWYVFDSLYCGWIEGDICPASEEYMITHIFPQTQPVLQKVGEEIIEAGGDGNGRPNPGEAVDLNIQVVNNGWDAVNPAVTLSTDDPYIAIEAASASLGDTLAWGETGFTQTPLKLAVDAGCPDPHVAVLHVTMAAEGGHTASDSIRIFIGNSAGLASDFEVDDNRWWHRPHTQFFGDQWHRETYRKHSGATSWKVGGTGGNYYDNALDAALTATAGDWLRVGWLGLTGYYL